MVDRYKGYIPGKQAAGRYSLLLKKSHGTFLLALAALLSISCAQTKQPDGADNKATETKVAVVDRSELQSGPVRLTAVVEPPRLSLSEEARLTLTIDYADGVDVKFPPFGKTVGGFRILDIKQPLPKTAEGRHVIEEILTLEPIETGRATIYPINVTYTDNSGADADKPGDGKQHSLRTEELCVEVTSVVEANDDSLSNLRPVAEPAAIPYPPRYLLWSSILVAVLIAAAVGLFWWRRKAIERARIRIMTPGELAVEALKRLRESQLAHRDAKLYYVELTGIVRVYIERTTGIRAPEQTTEEFLREITDRETFQREESVRLRNFLEAADLVKFAAYRPREEDIDDSFARAEEFVSYGEGGEGRWQRAEDRG